MIAFVVCALFSSGIAFFLTLNHLGWLRSTRKYPPCETFSVAVIVPCKGTDDPHFGDNLVNIISQEYAGPSQYVFCVESDSDSALPLLHRLEREHEHIQVCVAGLATTSAQKTFNILKGMDLAGKVEIFQFADADIDPHPTWLKEMVAPFGDPKVGAVTGTFRRVPITQDFRLGNYLAGFFGSIIVLGMSADPLRALWGGSLAIRSSVVEQIQLRERLATEIVDDIAIMQALHQHRIERRFVPSCTLKSYCEMSVRASIEWLVRQIQFMQIYFKGLYVFCHIFGLSYSVSILTAPLLFAYGVASADWTAMGTSVGFWLSVMLAGSLLRLGVPINRTSTSPTDATFRLLPWMLISPIAIVAGTYALLITLFRLRAGILKMDWRGIEYHVQANTGKVAEVIRSP